MKTNVLNPFPTFLYKSIDVCNIYEFAHLFMVTVKARKKVITPQRNLLLQILQGKASRRSPTIMMLATQSRLTILSMRTLSFTFIHNRPMVFTIVTIVMVIKNITMFIADLGKFWLMTITSSKKWIGSPIIPNEIFLVIAVLLEKCEIFRNIFCMCLLSKVWMWTEVGESKHIN